MANINKEKCSYSCNKFFTSNKEKKNSTCSLMQILIIS